VLAKVPPYDSSTPIAEAIRSDAIRFNAIKSAGRVAQRAVLQWLKHTDRNRPFFIFLNYMACHYSLIPARLYRERFMTPAQVEASYQVDRTIPTYWAYTLGEHEYSKEDLELTRATYDAALAELDGLFHNLLKRLDKKGYGENTIVVLTGDHGEHLGEHHMLDHQFSVYEPLMRVPLVLHAPGWVDAGRDQYPVTNTDIFPTLLEMVGVDPPVRSTGVSLLHPVDRRPRLGVYVGVMTAPLSDTRRRYPDFDPRPWNRTLRAYYDGPYKLVEGSDGRNELYRLDRDPGELHNVYSDEPQVAERLAGDLRAYLAALQPVTVRPPPQRTPMTKEDRERLRLLGYVDED
jgi:arylsulfatase A-like enzyme